MKGQTLFQGKLFQRVVGPAITVGSAEGPDDIFAPFHESLEDSPAERLLPVDDDAHLETSLVPRPPEAASLLA